MDREESGTKMEAAWKATYIRNGRTNDIGTIKFILPMQPKPVALTYSMTTSGTWEIVDGFLAHTTNELKLVNISHPGLDDIINLTDMFPQTVSDSSKILVLNDQRLELLSESTGIISQCDRIMPKT